MSAADSSRSSRMGPVSPWWRHAMVWLVIGGPLVVVLASVATLLIALAYPDPVLQLRTQAPVQQPAMQARNHAATPP